MGLEGSVSSAVKTPSGGVAEHLAVLAALVGHLDMAWDELWAELCFQAAPSPWQSANERALAPVIVQGVVV